MLLKLFLFKLKLKLIKKNTYGDLPVNIWLARRKERLDKAMLYVQNNTESKLSSLNDLIPMSLSRLRDELDKCDKLSNNARDEVYNWIRANRWELMRFYCKELSFRNLKKSLVCAKNYSFNEGFRKLDSEDIGWFSTPLRRKFKPFLPASILPMQCIPDIMNDIPYLYIQNTKKDKWISAKNMILIPLEHKNFIPPKNLVIPPESINYVLNWIDTNKEVLLDHWFQESCSSELVERLVF